MRLFKNNTHPHLFLLVYWFVLLFVSSRVLGCSIFQQEGELGFLFSQSAGLINTTIFITNAKENTATQGEVFLVWKSEDDTLINFNEPSFLLEASRVPLKAPFLTINRSGVVSTRFGQFKLHCISSTHLFGVLRSDIWMFMFNSSRPSTLLSNLDPNCFVDATNRTLDGGGCLSLSLLRLSESWKVRVSLPVKSNSISNDFGLLPPSLVDESASSLSYLDTPHTPDDAIELYGSPSYHSCVRRSLVRQVLYSTTYVEDRPQHIYHISIANDNLKPIKSLLLEITPTVPSSYGISHTWGMEKLPRKKYKNLRTPGSPSSSTKFASLPHLSKEIEYSIPQQFSLSTNSTFIFPKSNSDKKPTKSNNSKKYYCLVRTHISPGDIYSDLGYIMHGGETQLKVVGAVC